MNMFKHELKANGKSTLIWTISIVLVTIFFFSMYPTFSKEAESLRKMFEGFPEALLKAINFDINNFTSILGFYSYTFVYISLIGAIQAMNLGVGLVSKEIREKTADFLLTKPVTRQQVMTAKISAAVTSILITNLAFIITVLGVSSVVADTDYSQKLFFLITLSLLFIQIIFFAIGLVISVAVQKIKSVLPISLGTVFGFFVINSFAKSFDDEKLSYLSPFHYFDSLYILQHEAYKTSYVIIGVVIVLISVLASYFIYIKKDIHAV